MADDYDRRRRKRWRREVDRDADRGPWRRQRNAWTRVARRLGLVVQDVAGVRVHMRGRAAGSAVDVVRDGRGRTFEWTVAVSRAGLDETLTLTRENAVTRARKLIGGDDVRTGESGFDFLVHADGDAGRLLAALDHVGRRRVYELVERGGRVENGSFTIVRRTTSDNDAPERLRRDIEHGAQLLKRLSAGTDKVRARLRQNARTERNVGVRAVTLDHLRRRYPEDVGRMDWRLDDHDPHVIAWRMALMSRRTETVALERWANDERLVVGARVAFLERLERRFPKTDAIAAVERLMHGPLDGAATRVLLSRVDERPIVRELRTETLYRLMRDGRVVARIRLAHTLELLGRLDAIDVLVPYTSGLLLHRDVKDATRRAVASIQRRSQGRSGRLSMIRHDGGSLSVAGEAGSLSVND